MVRENWRPIWTEEELKILRQNEGKSRKEIAKLLPRRSVQAIYIKMHREGLAEKVDYHQWTKEEEEYIRENVDKLSYNEIAKNLRLSYDVVQAKGYHLIGSKPTIYSEKLCARCGTVFRPKKSSQAYCSTDCQERCRVCDVKLTSENTYVLRDHICKECFGKLRRQNKLTTVINGERVTIKTEKRPLPDVCEICGIEWEWNKASRYAWHHWDDEKPENGIWVCNKCHWLCNAYEAVHSLKNRERINKYLKLKNYYRS